MAKSTRPHGLQIDQDLKYQRREWLFERIAWVVMALVLILAALGLFGHGLASRSDVTNDSGRLRLQYDRFLRHHSPSTLTVELDGAATANGEARVWLNREFLEGVELTQIAPEPLRVETTADRQLYVFRAAEAGQTVVILFRFEPEGSGRLRGEIAVDDGSPLQFRSFVYP